MKHQTLFSAVLPLILLSATAFAQDTPRPERPAGRFPGLRPQNGERPEFPGAFAQRMPLMMALDADQDGTISASEIENASKALMKLDKDGDGALSMEELRPDFSGLDRERMAREGQPGANGAPTKEMMARMFEQRDANKDGKLSGDELPDRMKENLARVDENGDGAIDKAELEKAMARIGDRAGQQRGAKDDKDGAGVKPRRPPVE